jgi:thiol-disulfide isomerase/thioredoxin
MKRTVIALSAAILAGHLGADTGGTTDVSDAQAGLALNKLENRMDSGLMAGWDGAGSMIETAVRERPQDADAEQMLSEYLYVYEGHHSLADSASAWATAGATGNGTIKQWALKKASFFESAKSPIDLAFTAADGRAVDLHALRGKVVLLDFWATWCPPCREELPNVKAAYERFHDRGFEIVGISLDVSPANEPGKSWTRTATQLIDFTRKEDMPWPQQYEGKKHGRGGNALADRFAVNFIPECFLLGPDGKIVAMGLRGFDLSDAVGKLLDQAPKT